MQTRTVSIFVAIIAIVAITLWSLISASGPTIGATKAHATDEHEPSSTSALAKNDSAGLKMPDRPKPPQPDVPPEAARIPPTTMTDNPTLRILVDKAASPRFSSDFHSRVPTISNPTDIEWMIYILRDHTDLDAVRNEVANLLRRSRIPETDRYLLAVLDSPLEKERFQSYAVQHLSDMMREFTEGTKPEDLVRARAIKNSLANALKNPHFMVRSEALMALARERDPRAADIIRKGLTDSPWEQGQDLLIRCAKEAGLNDLIPTIRPLAYSTNEVVRIAAVNVLAQWRDEVSRPAFEEASRSTVPRLQRAGALALSLMDQQQ